MVIQNTNCKMVKCIINYLHVIVKVIVYSALSLNIANETWKDSTAQCCE